jgi:TetR/AcrR family fatty acid metabolism transcriptional regulator
MDDVASDAGVAKGTVYLYCENKQDLYVRALEADLQAWMDELGTDLDGTDRPATELLLELATRDRDFVESHRLAADLLTGAADAHVPGARHRLDELRALGLSQVVKVLRYGVERGEFAADLDVEPTARVLQDMQLTAAVLVHQSDLPTREVRRRQRAAVRLVLRGLEARDR